MTNRTSTDLALTGVPGTGADDEVPENVERAGADADTSADEGAQAGPFGKYSAAKRAATKNTDPPSGTPLPRLYDEMITSGCFQVLAGEARRGNDDRVHPDYDPYVDPRRPELDMRAPAQHWIALGADFMLGEAQVRPFATQNDTRNAFWRLMTAWHRYAVQDAGEAWRPCVNEGSSPRAVEAFFVAMGSHIELRMDIDGRYTDVDGLVDLLGFLRERVQALDAADMFERYQLASAVNALCQQAQSLIEAMQQRVRAPQGEHDSLDDVVTSAPDMRMFSPRGLGAIKLNRAMRRAMRWSGAQIQQIEERCGPEGEMQGWTPFSDDLPHSADIDHGAASAGHDSDDDSGETVERSLPWWWPVL